MTIFVMCRIFSLDPDTILSFMGCVKGAVIWWTRHICRVQHIIFGAVFTFCNFMLFLIIFSNFLFFLKMVTVCLLR